MSRGGRGDRWSCGGGCARLHPGDRAFLADLAKLKTPAVAVINKLDLVSRDRLIMLADEAHNALPGAEVVQ